MSNVPNWTYKENKNGDKQLLFKGRVATRKGVRRGTRGGKTTYKRVTLPGNVNSKGGRVSYKKLRNKAKNLGLPVVSVEKRTEAVKALLAEFKKTPPPSHRLTRTELVNAILSNKNLPKFVPKERKERSNKGKARKTNEQKAATKKARANRAKAKRATLDKRLKAAAEKAKAANAAAAAANAEVVNLQAQVARQAKRKAVEETNANKNRAVKRVKVARQLQEVGSQPKQHQQSPPRTRPPLNEKISTYDIWP
jgi:hypothetical protein